MSQALQPDLQSHRAEAVEHLQALLRFDTTNPPGNETPAVEYLAGVLSGDGYEPQILESAPGRGNLVARYRGSGELPPLLLYGHVDVVMAEPGRWMHHPFSGDLADGCIWGRGALDMKSLVVQELMVMLLLARSDVHLRRDVIFAATADEEVGGDAGMGYLVDRHPDLIRAEWALSEGAGTTMYIGGKPVYDIRTAEKGTYRFKLRAHGPPGHGSKPVPGTAVDRVARAVVALSSTPLPFRVTQTAARFFETITTLLDLPRPLRKLDEESLRRVVKVLPPDMGYYLSAITHDTAVPTGLRGGQKINVIPSEAEAWVDGRYLPGGTAERFLDEVRAVVGDGYEIEPVDITAPLESRTGGPLWDTIVSVMRRRAPDAAIVPVMLAGATDAKHVERLGTRCLGFGPLYVPPEFPAERLVHGHDERVPVEGYLWGLDTLLDIVVQFCR